MFKEATRKPYSALGHLASMKGAKSGGQAGRQAGVEGRRSWPWTFYSYPPLTVCVSLHF